MREYEGMLLLATDTNAKALTQRQVIDIDRFTICRKIVGADRVRIALIINE